MSDKNTKRFRRMALLTIVATIFLIWVGGLVRSTGSGMGCPDWPKCFGQVVPPTDVKELPENYKDVYAELRRQKNQRISTRLEKMGFTAVAEKMRNDPSMYVEEDFNVTKTWIEYLNRLLGVLVGFFIFLTMLFSIPLRKLDWKITALSFAGFILVGLEGWLGSIVVSTNLMPGIISLHMMLAMFLLMVLITAYLRTSKMSQKITIPKSVIYLGMGLVILVLIQILLGTQVREAIDKVHDELGEQQRDAWLQRVGTPYILHRSFYYVLTLAMLMWFSQLKKFFPQEKKIRWLSFSMLGFLGLEILLGLSMHYFSIPPVAQPLHLLFSTLILSNVYYLLSILFRLNEVE
jgi:heme a synthase